MSVVEGERNVPDTPQNRGLYACDCARLLAIHTIKICNNKNIFLPEYQDAMTDKIISVATDIFVNAWGANNIKVDNDPERGREEYNLKRITDQLQSQGFQPNPKKTHVTPLRNGFKFLGWGWRVTENGKVIMLLDSQNIHHERKRLYRMARKVKRGDSTKDKADECFNAWKAYASKGNTYKVIQRMDAYYQNLWR